MGDESGSLGDFEAADWSIDYTDPATQAEVRKVLADPYQRELLLTDYEQAAADARNRDRTLHNSIYLGFIVLGVLVNGLISVQETPSNIFIVGGLGAVIFFFLTFWSANSRGARNASWDRRSEIEDMVKATNGLVLRSNDSSFKRLQRNPDQPGYYELRGKDASQEVSIGNLAPWLHASSALVFVLVALIALLDWWGCL